MFGKQHLLLFLLAGAVAIGGSVAFEPGTLAYQYLQRNVRLNDLQSQVTLHNAAAGSKEAVMPLSVVA